MAKIPSVHVPAEVKNLAINGAFDFWQRVEANTSTINTATTSTAYTADMFLYSSGGSTVKNYSVVQSATVPTLAQSGFESTFGYLFTMITGIASFAASDFVVPLEYRMEGLDYQRIHSKNATISFWIEASVAGTYSLALGNAAGTRSYVTTFSVSAANTWQFITVSLPLDSTAFTSSWLFTNVSSLVVYVGTVAGTTSQTSTLNAWQAGAFVAATGATNWMTTNGATLNIAQFSITESNLGLGATGFQRAGKTIQQELALCQRYYEKTYDQGTVPGTATGPGASPINSQSQAAQPTGWNFVYKVSKRAAGTATVYSPFNGASGNASVGGSNIGVSLGTSTTVGVFFFTSSAATAGNGYVAHVTVDSGL